MATNPKEFISMESPFKDPAVEENGKEKGEQGTEENEVQGFGPSIKVWEQLKKTSRNQLIIASVVMLLTGIILGAGVTAIIFTQTAKSDDDVSPVAVAITSGRQNISGNGTMEETTASSEVANSTLITTATPSTVVAAETTVSKETATTTPISLDTEVTAAIPYGCDIRYRGKCFRAIVGDDLTVHFNQSKELCAEAGLQLANIYSKSHYFMVEGYLRSNFPISGYISAWTGMKIAPREGQIVLSTGKNATLLDVLWHKGYPSRDPEYTHIGLDFLKLPTNDNFNKQGLWNYDPSWNANSAICEEL